MSWTILALSLSFTVTASTDSNGKITAVVPKALRAGEKVTVQIEVPTRTDFKEYIFVVFWRVSPPGRHHESPGLRDNQVGDIEPRPGFIRYSIPTDERWLGPEVLAGKRKGEKYQVFLLHSKQEKLPDSPSIERSHSAEELTVTPGQLTDARTEDVIRWHVAWLEKRATRLARIESQTQLREELGRGLWDLRKHEGTDAALVWEEVLMTRRELGEVLPADSELAIAETVPVALERPAAAYYESAKATEQVLSMIGTDAERKGLLTRLGSIMNKLKKLVRLAGDKR